MSNSEKQEIPSSLLEEFRYLNDLSLARIRDANFFWISSLMVIGPITAYAIQAKSFIAILIEILMLPAFSLGIIWQLDGIARVRD